MEIKNEQATIDEIVEVISEIILKASIQKSDSKVLKELDKIEAKKKAFEAYEEEIISKNDFSERIADIKAIEEIL